MRNVVYGVVVVICLVGGQALAERSHVLASFFSFVVGSWVLAHLVLKAVRWDESTDYVTYAELRGNE